jgi:hypothetical protein
MLDGQQRDKNLTYGITTLPVSSSELLDDHQQKKSLPVSRGIKSLIVSSEIKSSSATYGIKTLPVSCR